jgi:hypothetical protein
MFFLWLGILILVFTLFFSTFYIKKGEDYQVAWIKAKLRVNSVDIAGFYRMIPGQGMRYYSIKKELIDETENRISIVELLSSHAVN